MQAKHSITRFLLYSIFAIILLGWVVSAALNFHDSKEQIAEIFDAELAQMSRVLQALISADLSSSPSKTPSQFEYLDQEVLKYAFEDEEYSAIGHEYERKIAIQVWNRDGELILANHLPLPNDFSRLIAGYTNLEFSGYGWRSFTLIDSNNGLRIRVAQREDVRTELTGEIARHSIIPGILIVPLILLLTVFAIRRGLAPLHAISTELKERDYNNLAPIETQDTPLELRAMVNELNKLFRRSSASYAREKRFTADAAHELRTPLSIAKVHLQNLQQISQEENVRSYVGKALRGIERLIHLVQQLLILSRLEAEQASELKQPVSLTHLVHEVVSEAQDNPNYKHLSWHLAMDQEVTLSATETDIRVLLRNLIDNACRYASPDTTISVALNPDELRLFNLAPALKEEDIPALFERFKRGAGQKIEGSGLGLAICQQIAQRYALALTLENATLDEQSGILTRLKLRRAD